MRSEQPSTRGRRRALVFLAGGIVDSGLLPPRGGDDVVVAADSGLHAAAALGVPVDFVVGDLDSVATDALDRAAAAGAAILRFPAEKDKTDMALAIGQARAAGAAEVLVIGSASGRFDHVIANTLLLTSPEFADLELSAVFGPARLWALHGPGSVRLTGARGDLCSLLAAGGPAAGIATDGLLYPLRGETLHPGSSRGVSNALISAEAVVSLDAGTLLAVMAGGSPRSLP